MTKLTFSMSIPLPNTSVATINLQPLVLNMS